MTQTKSHYSANPVTEPGANLGEGPTWDHRLGCLYWVDITAGTLHIHGSSTRTNTSHKVSDEMLGCLFLTTVPGVLILALESGFHRYNVNSKELTKIANAPTEGDTHRFNDGKCGPGGELWIGTMAQRGSGDGQFYRIDDAWNSLPIGEPMPVPNGVEWSLDGRTLYHCNTVNKRINTYEYDATKGHVTQTSGAIDLSHLDGAPDGIALDTQGHLWIAFWGGSCVRCIDPANGSVLSTIDLPVPCVTSVAFGGAQFDDLFITTASNGGSVGGALYHAKVDVPGRPENIFSLN